MKSLQIERELGAMVLDNHDTKVSLKQFKTEIGIEILPRRAFVFTDRTRCHGGLPLGVSGKALALIEDRNSLLAAWLLMKRGVVVKPIATRQTDIDLLKKYSYGHRIELREINGLGDVPALAGKERAIALVTGQTLDTFEDLDLPILTLRPIIGYGKKELKELDDSIK
jgi:adenylyl- and sulfurtransferase ThiI